MLTTESRSFQRGTASLCKSKDCEVTIRQTLRMIKLSGTQPWAASVWFNSGRATEYFIKPLALTAYLVIKSTLSSKYACVYNQPLINCMFSIFYQ